MEVSSGVTPHAVFGAHTTSRSGSSLQQPAQSAQPMKLRSEHESFA